MRRFAVGLIALALVAAGCSDDGEGTTTSPAPTVVTTIPSTTPVATAAPSTTQATATTTTATPDPIVVTSEAGTIELAAPAERIAVLSAAHVEMLFAVGAGERVIAVDMFSNYPPEAADLPQLDSFNLSVESVIALDPDLVVLTFDPGDTVAALDAVGIPTILFSPAPTLDAAYEQMRSLGAAVERSGEADALVAGIEAELNRLVAEVDGRAIGLTYYHETDPFGFFTPNSSSFIGQLYSLLGMDNIADAAPDEFGSGYPQLSPEFIVESDPDVIFIGAFGENLETVAARDAWSTMSAVAAGRVFVVDADESSRWGPRIVDFFADITEAVLTLELVES